MGWLWFIPVYLQITVFLPFLLLTYRLIKNKIVISVMIMILMSFFFVLNIVTVRYAEEGAVPIFSDDNRNFSFYANYYMMPWYHANPYLLGMGLAMIYFEFVKDRSSNSTEEFEESVTSFPARVLIAIYENAWIRFLLYFLGLGLTLSVFLGG